MRRYLLMAVIAAVTGLAVPISAGANDFMLTFEWGDIPLCTSGYPNRVPKPVFVLSGVPQSTARIDFRMTDLHMPSYDHGGGRVAYSGQTTIEPGSFRYASPCPPGGRHQYRWTASAKDENGDTLAKAIATKWYP